MADMIYSLCQKCGIAAAYEDFSLMSDDDIDVFNDFIENVGLIGYVGNDDDYVEYCDCCGTQMNIYGEDQVMIFESVN